VAAQNEPVGPRPLRAVPDDGYPDWEAVYRDNATWVYRTLFARVGNRADAEDLTTEVFLAALRPLRLTASVGEVRAYLRATARTVLAAHWRSTLGREVTSIEDIEALNRARAHNERWLPWFSERLAALGLSLTPSVANFVLARFPEAPQKNADAACAFLQSRGILTRKMGAYGLPQHLRITIGTGLEMQTVANALAEFMAAL